MEADELSIELARKHKKLLFWKKWLVTNDAGLNTEEERKFASLLKDYANLISQASTLPVAGATPAETPETFSKLSALERELTATLEKRRLMTSSVGIGAVGSK